MRWSCFLGLVLGCLALFPVSGKPPSTHLDTARRLTPAQAEHFASLPLACIGKEFPNIIHHVMDSAADVARPSRLTPAFYGCYDWHSSVHGHWLLVRLLRLHPEAGFAPAARAALAQNLTEAKLLQEAAYMAHPARAGFERPYGHAWLLQLVSELEQWDDPDARQWREHLRPLETVTVRRLGQWLPKLRHPIRGGEHYQTAFAFGLIHDYAMQRGDTALRQQLHAAGQRFYSNDRHCPLNYEPSGHDFLSACLAEADFMRRLLPADAFADWLRAFLPQIGQRDWLPRAEVSDRADGKLAHIDGLLLSRAWMLEGIASGLPADDPRRATLLAAAHSQGHAGLSAVDDTHYAGSRWLASFAVYWLSARGLSIH